MNPLETAVARIESTIGAIVRRERDRFGRTRLYVAQPVGGFLYVIDDSGLFDACALTAQDFADMVRT